MASALRITVALLVVAALVVGLYVVLTVTAFGQDLVDRLLSSQSQAVLPDEEWFAWQDMDGGRCFIDTEPDAPRVTDADRAQPVACVPSLPATIRHEIFALQTRASNRGRDQYRRVTCQRLDSLPPCCLPDRPGLRATASATTASGKASPQEAFGVLCQARYGCETDSVYVSGLVPWVEGNPVNCLREANVNTCAHLLLERVDPGVLRPDPALLTSANTELMTYLCTNDSRTRASQVVPGPQLPRFTAEEMRVECAAQGFQPPQTQECVPAGGRAAGRKRRQRSSQSWLLSRRQDLERIYPRRDSLPST